MKTFLSCSGFVLRLQLIVCTIIILSAGCKKDIQSVEITGDPGTFKASGSIPSYYFDWEAATYMPSLPNANLVPMPWNSGTTAIDANLVSDYKTADGWVLVWNTFRPDVQLNDPGYSYYFALYNRYRGILRFYLWQPGTPVATNYVQHGLKLYGAQTSPMLIHNAQEMGDLTNKQVQFSQVLNQTLSLSGGTWLVFQYDIAYDPNLSATTFPNFGLEWDAKWASVSQITLNGNISGEIKGYIGNPSSNDIDFGALLDKAVTTLWGEQAYASYLLLLSGNGDSYTKSMSNGVNGIVKGFLNAIIGGSSAGPQPVNLTINAKVKLDGSLTTNGGIINKKLALPGQSNSQTADGLTPLFNSTMGIMNLSASPTVYIDIVQYDEQFVDAWDNYYYQTQYHGTHRLDNNSYNIIWNSDIINNSPSGATIQNLTTQLVKVFKQWDPFIHNGLFGSIPVGAVMEFSGDGETVYDGSFDQIETIGKQDVVAGFPNSNTPIECIGLDDDFGTDTGVRISFDVVPNNGAPRSKHVKTFRANIVKRH